MKSVFVSFVKTHLLQINTLRLGRARRGAALNAESSLKRVKIRSIKYIGKQDVYNMEVRDHHNFSVNGGLIVHNCLDSDRYFCYTIVRMPRATRNYSGKGAR